jgi:uncharacterized protein DUF1905/bacteriocin resistance YdeI/OmpD-like protein
LKENAKDREFTFVAQLVQVERGGYYAVDVPARISKAVGKRGPVPVSARVNNVAHFKASLSPAGGGRHRLRMNSRTREIADAEPGDSVKVHIIVLRQPLKVTLPEDLKTALRGEGVRECFEALAPGKQNHIVDWINRSARMETREKRIQLAVEVTHLRREKQLAREARKGVKRNAKRDE